MDSTRSPEHSQAVSASDQVRNFINETLVAIIEQLSMSDGKPSITIKRRGNNMSFFINPRNGALESPQRENCVTYSWPGKDIYEAWRFTVAIRVLSAISEALHSGLVISKRDIYYSDPVCFGSQRVVDGLVDDFALTIGVDRSALNVEAAAKGLVAGYYQLTTTTNEIVDARLSTKDTLIPRVQDIATIDMSNVNWVLVLEKEAVYRRLVRSSYHTRARAGKGILITGKGYPDLGTRAFLRKIYENGSQSQDMVTPRFYALVDSDPDGMAIMSTYKYGSMAHTAENGNLNIPGLSWLGLRTSDIVGGRVDTEEQEEGLIRLTKRDRRKVITMLSRNPVWAVDGPELEWRVELQTMLILNVKAEMEILYDKDGGLEGWIDQQIERLSSCRHP